MMSTIYYVLGAIVFWLGSFLLAYLILNWLYYSVWDRYCQRTWVYQIYEYARFNRRFKQARANGYSDFNNMNWRSIEIHSDRVKGRADDYFKYKSRHLFKKQLIKAYDEMLNSPAYHVWKKAETEEY